MQGRSHLAAPVLVLLGIFSIAALAQSPRPDESGSRPPPLVARTIPAPDWLVWFSFYDLYGSHLRAASAESNSVNELVASRLGIEVKIAAQVFELGKIYAQEIQRLLTEKQRALDPGSRDNVESAKISALQDHRVHLVQLIGPEASDKLALWLDSEMKIRIRAVRMERASSTEW